MAGLLHIFVRGTDRSIDLKDGVRVAAGRAPDCDIQIDDQSVSRHHLTLDRRGEEIEVTDLESVISRRIEPSRFDWLSSAPAAGPGTHFDPAIADVVIRLHQRGELLPGDGES